MKIGFIVPTRPQSLLPPLYKLIKKSRKSALRKNHPLSAFNLTSIPGKIIYKPSIGVLALGTALKKEGHSLNILHEDYCIQNGIFESKFDQLIQESELIGITSLTEMYPHAVTFLNRIKSKRENLPVVIGGPHVSIMDNEAINDGFDYVVKGYGEKSIIQLVRAIESSKGFKNVKGLTYIQQGQIKRNVVSEIKGEEIENPDYSLIPDGMKKYCEIPLFTSRGCPYSCNFCVENGKYTCKPIDKVIEDISYAKATFPLNNYFISDSVFGIDSVRTRVLVKEIHQNFPDLFFYYQNRLDLIDSNMIAFLAKHNFIGLWVGIESLSNNTLVLMNKGAKETFENFYSTLKRIKNLIPYIEGSFIIGYPGETKNDFRLTLSRLELFLAEGLLSYASSRLFVPYPGTQYFIDPPKYEITINNNDYSKFTRHSFPPNFRTQNFSELELYVAMLEFNSIVSRYIHDRNGINSYETIDMRILEQ